MNPSETSFVLFRKLFGSLNQDLKIVKFFLPIIFPIRICSKENNQIWDKRFNEKDVQYNLIIYRKIEAIQMSKISEHIHHVVIKNCAHF